MEEGGLIVVIAAVLLLVFGAAAVWLAVAYLPGWVWCWAGWTLAVTLIALAWREILGRLREVLGGS